MLSLSELRRAASALEGLVGARLQAAGSVDACTLALELYGGEPPGRIGLVLSCDPRLARVGRSRRARRAGGRSGETALLQYLRAHGVGSRLESAALVGDDRHLRLGFAGRDGRFDLRLLLMGGRSNLYLVDAEGRLVAALRPIASTRRELALGEAWADPAPAARPAGADRFADVADADLLEAIEAAYAEEVEGRSQDDRLRRARAALRKRRAALERKARALERDAQAGAKADAHRRHGELLKGVLREVRPGADAVGAVDPETGEQVSVPLDPSLSAVENMERLFRRHRKAAVQARQTVQRQAELGAQQDEIEALEAALERAEAEGDVEAFCARPEMAKLLARHAPQAAPRERTPRRKGPLDTLPARLRPRRYRSHDGLEIWVGRSDEGNDLLSTRLARGKDVFVHIEGAPGSHVVLRTGGRDDPPQESLLEACELALHFSSQRGASRVGVHLARAADVRKPRGARRGLVEVLRGRTLTLRHDAERLRRVLGARIEEHAGGR